MPAPKIRADYDQLTNIAKQFDQQAESAERILRDLTQKEQVLQSGDWIGQGAQAFYSEMESGIIPAITRLINALRMASQVSNAVRDLMQGTEGGVSSIFKKASANVAAGKSAAGMAASGGGAGAAAGAGAAGAAGGRSGAGGSSSTGGTAGAGGAGRTGGASSTTNINIAINLPAWLNQMLGLGGNGNAPAGGDKLDQFVDEIHHARDLISSGKTTTFELDSDSDFPSQKILDAVKADLASQSDASANGWQQQGAGSGGGSGGGSGSGGGAPSATTPTDAKQTPQTGGGGGGGGGGDQSPSGGGSMGAGGSGSVSGQQGLVGNAAAQGGGGSGGVFGGGDTPGSFGAAVVAGSLRAAGAGAPIAEVAIMVGASAGGLLFATKGGAGGLGGFAAGQFARNAASPLFRSVSG